MTLTAVREKPILFSEPMVRAILDGRKTQTRRIIKPQPHKSISYFEFLSTCFKPVWSGPELDEPDFLTLNKCIHCPYGGVGDRLWVRETWRPIVSGRKAGGFDYLADDPGASGAGFMPWKPSIHMPRKASRLTLEITRVRVERLKSITVEDAKAEGVGGPNGYELDQFYALWSKINGAESWNENPWVWVVEFKRAESPA